MGLLAVGERANSSEAGKLDGETSKTEKVATESRKTTRPARRPTLSLIAREAGVTKTTASRALNGQPGVSDEVRRKIRQIADDMGYVTNWVAKTLSAARHDSDSGIIAVIAEIHTPHMAAMAEAVGEAVRASGKDMLVYSRPDPGSPMPKSIRDVLTNAVDGVIAILPRDGDALEALARAHIPVVVIDPRVKDATIPSVAADYYAGTRAAMRHLIDLSHTRIALLTRDPDRLAAVERLRGYRDAMTEAGLEIQEDLIVTVTSLTEPATSAVKALLTRADRPTAIFAWNDPYAIDAMEAAEALGLRVPEELSIVGFDDIPLAEKVKPALTTVRQCYSKIGVAAVDLLWRLRDGERPAEMQKSLPIELVVRGTTAAVEK